MIRIRSAFAAVLALALSGVGLAWAGAGPAGSAPATGQPAPLSTGVPPTLPPSPPLSWIITVGTLDNLLAHDTSGIVQQTFDTPTTYVLVTAGQGVPPGWTSVPTQNFKSYQNMNTELHGGVGSDGTRMVPGIRAVLYDDENWDFTPPNERSDPAHYIQLAGQLAHGTLVNGAPLAFVSTPAVDLFGSVSAYLDSGIAKVAARYADLYDIQAQGQQGDLQSYTDFVAQAATQARQVSAATTIVAGVTTNHTGQKFTAAQLDAAMHSVPRTVTGYWMNDPGDPDFCPTCPGPLPDVAIAALQNL